MRLVVFFILFFSVFNVQGQCQDSTFWIQDIFYLKATPIVEEFNWCIYSTETDDKESVIEGKQQRKHILDSLIQIDPKNPILYAYKIRGSLDTDSKFYVDELDSIYSKFPTNSFINYSIFDVLPYELYDKRKFHLQEAIKYNTDSTQLSKLIMQEIFLDTTLDFHSKYNLYQKALQYDSTNSEIHQKIAEIYYHFGCMEEAEKHYNLYIYYKYQKYYTYYFKKSFYKNNLRIDEYGSWKFGDISFNFELSHFLSENSKKIKQFQIVNPSYLFYKLNNNNYRLRIFKEDSIYFNYTKTPYVYSPVNFETLDSLNTLILIGNDSDFIPEIPRSILNIKSLKKIEFGLGMHIPKSEMEFIAKNYPNIELIYDNWCIDEKGSIEYRRSFYERLNKAGFPKSSK